MIFPLHIFYTFVDFTPVGEMIVTSRAGVNNAYWVMKLLFFLILLSGVFPCAWCADGDDDSQSSNAAMSPFVTALIYSQISNFTSVFNKDITENLGFCIKDV